VTSVSSLRWTDDDLLQELGAALREPPVDPDITAAAYAAFGWRNADAELELMILVAEAQPEPSGGVRSGKGAPRTLTFRGDRISVEVEVDEDGIVGQLIPPRPGQVTLVTASGAVAAAQADEVGCFTLPAPPPGPLRLDCQLDGERFVTEWTTG
jgi:hypothetical protein